jgi:glycosyltransferase involved in cell wall biosynthesis
MINILIVILQKKGSGPVFALELAHGLAQNGCYVYAAVASGIDNREKWEEDKIIRKISFIETGNTKTFFKSLWTFIIKGHKNLQFDFGSTNFDLVINTYSHPWNEIIARYIKHKRVASICHDPINHLGTKALRRIVNRRFVKAADDVIVLTKTFVPIIEKNYGFTKDRIHYMPHGRMDIYKREQIITKESRYRNDKINFLFFGRIKEYKGLHILSEAYKMIKQKYDCISLTIVGDGDFSSYRENFENIEDVTIINKYIADNEVGCYFDGPNIICVLPYLDATQSGVIPIAMEYDSSIIASNTGGLREQLDGGRIGIFCEPGDSKDLAEKMEYIVNNMQARENQIILMRNYLNSLDWDVVGEGLLKSFGINEPFKNINL